MRFLTTFEGCEGQVYLEFGNEPPVLVQLGDDSLWVRQGVINKRVHYDRAVVEPIKWIIPHATVEVERDK